MNICYFTVSIGQEFKSILVGWSSLGALMVTNNRSAGLQALKEAGGSASGWSLIGLWAEGPTPHMWASPQTCLSILMTWQLASPRPSHPRETTRKLQYLTVASVLQHPIGSVGQFHSVWEGWHKGENSRRWGLLGDGHLGNWLPQPSLCSPGTHVLPTHMCSASPKAPKSLTPIEYQFEVQNLIIQTRSIYYCWSSLGVALWVLKSSSFLSEICELEKQVTCPLPPNSIQL